MTRYTIKNNTFPNLPDRLNGLGDLAENLWWSWNPQARMLYKMLDRQAWKDSGHNPDRMLKTISPKALQEAAQDANYLRHYDLVMSQFRSCINRSVLHPLQERECPVAYFSAEYGLHHSLPFYAGGLGFLAGDHLKECSDLHIPLVALGFMYPSGYLQQIIRSDGWQENETQTLDRESASINQVWDENGEQLTVQVPIIKPTISVTLWKVAVGQVDLLLMDTENLLNDPWIRSIAQRLYTSDPEQRLLQEIILGIGGYNVLRQLGIDYCMLHLNEGHAAFTLLEAMREFIQEGLSFEQARQQILHSTLFTTHTPVQAGHDVFPFELIDKYFHNYWPYLELDREAFFDLGRHPEHPQAGFNMTALALRLSGSCNGVSQKHARVSRAMWQPLWPDRSQERIPIDAVTNGIHLPTWLEPKLRLLFNKYFGEGWLQEHDNPAIWEFIEEIPDKEIWQTHYWLKMKLLNYIRHLARERWRSSADPSVLAAQGTMLDPSILTLGFARRFATYKRADLIFYDLERLKGILRDRWRPIQIIFAGKAHPADDGGKRIIQRIFNLARDPQLAGRVAFVENYNEQLAQYLVHGVDIWLNNPKPPMEASGTSGMKAALNGVPHLSVLDGWWIEGYNGQNGWAIGNTQDQLSDSERDEQDAYELYRLLEEDIIPLYYQSSEAGVPHDWVRKMKNSIKSTASYFSARRMVREYADSYYYKLIG